MAKQHRRKRSHSKPRRSYVTLPLGIRVQRKVMRNLGMAALVSMLGMSGLAYYIFSELSTERSPQVQAPDTDAEVAQGTAEAVGFPLVESTELPASPELATPTTLNSLLEKYRAVSGLNAVNSLLLHGSYDEDGRRFAMRLAAKSPNLLRKTLSDPELEMTYYYSGAEPRIEIEHKDRGAISAPVEDILYRKSLLLECSILTLAVFEEGLGYEYVQDPDQEYAGILCWTVVSRSPSGAVLNHLIDPETGYELVRYVSFEREGRSHQMSVHFSDFRDHGEGMLPFRYELKLDGVRRGLAELESIQTNPGLMPWMFTRNVPTPYNVGDRPTGKMRSTAL